MDGVPIHRERGVVGVFFQDVQGHVQHRQKPPARLLECPPELAVPMSVGNDFDSLMWEVLVFTRGKEINGSPLLVAR